MRSASTCGNAATIRFPRTTPGHSHAVGRFGDLSQRVEFAAALAVIYLKSTPGTSGRSGQSAAAFLAADDGGDIRYPVIDAALNRNDDDHTANFFQANEITTYDLSGDTILKGPWPIAYSWPGLAGTDFAAGVSTATAIPNVKGVVWLFRGSKYVRFSVSDDRVLVGPKEIYDGWPGLRGTTFMDYIDPPPRTPAAPTPSISSVAPKSFDTTSTTIR
ncbi:hemopexin repeat-containing protein [Spongiactinospora sp. TRM90649]|uniref:hemopexin repeat-containing protein n=1 Tax=Spongiactinospora sp. TRM90649 TaxID=3031114 RepID=UPI0023F90236|nr:hemopexin repeat-containing protein [Spongiactinospora sp. TRM90649]MDF5753015.1 hemopexin repeat-containing protein [Spongiactinospora sp. TRM90649]